MYTHTHIPTHPQGCKVLMSACSPLCFLCTGPQHKNPAASGAVRQCRSTKAPEVSLLPGSLSQLPGSDRDLFPCLATHPASGSSSSLTYPRNARTSRWLYHVHAGLSRKTEEGDAFQSSGLNSPQKTMTLMDICLTRPALQSELRSTVVFQPLLQSELLRIMRLILRVGYKGKCDLNLWTPADENQGPVS